MPKLSHKWWVPMITRLNDCDYIDLGPTAQACLVNLCMSAFANGETSVRGRVSHFASWFGWRPNWVSESLTKLEASGFVSIDRSDDPYLTVTIIGAEKLPGMTSCQSPVRDELETSQRRVGAESELSQRRVGDKSETKESSNDAGFSGQTLNRREEKRREEIKEETPQTPQGAECAMPKKKREKPEDDPQWEQFWRATGKRVDKANALKVWAKLSEADRSAAIEGMSRQCEQHRNRPDFIDNGWQFFRGPATWLRARAWEDEPAEAPKAQHEPPAAPRNQTRALMEWFGAHRAWKQFRDEASAIEATRLAHAAIAEDATADWLPAPHHAAAVVPQFIAEYAAECSSAN